MRSQNGISFFFSSRRRHTRSTRDWSSDVCSSDLDRARAGRGDRRRYAARIGEPCLVAVGGCAGFRLGPAGIRDVREALGGEGVMAKWVRVFTPTGAVRAWASILMVILGF